MKHHFLTVESTLQLVALLYAGKTDRGGQPKADHVRRVVFNLPRYSSVDRCLIAALHDSKEDNGLTEGIITGLFCSYTATKVAMLTHDPAVTGYDDYIDAMIAIGDPDVLHVKLADNTDNICPRRRSLLSETDRAWHVDRCERVYYPTRRKLIAAIKDITGEVLE